MKLVLVGELVFGRGTLISVCCMNRKHEHECPQLYTESLKRDDKDARKYL